MVTVHQGIYGDKSGSYALLKTSMTDIEQAKRLCNVTDTLDRPLNGNLTQPIIRAFACLDFYIFIKSFRDISSGVRQGRVFSHVMIIEQANLHMLNNINTLFLHFISSPEKNAELNVININESADSIPPVNFKSREAAAINGLLNHSDYDNTLVWIGEDSYLDFIACIWSQLNGSVRAKLKLGVGFSPQKVDTHNLNILYVTEEYEAKWKASNYYIVGKDDCGTLDSMSALLLAGHKEKAEPLRDLIKTFGIEPTMPEDYSYLEKVVNTHANLSSATDFNALIVLCDLISKDSPNQTIAKTEKEKLLKQVLSRIESASVDEILALKNVTWHGFYNAEKIVGQKIVAWAARYLFDPNADAAITNVMISAFDETNMSLWWKNAILNGLRYKLNEWQPSYASILWGWFKFNPTLVFLLYTFIPDTPQIEKDFVNHWTKSTQELFKTIQIFAQKRKWLILHGIATLQIHNAEDSINFQLEIDTNPEYLTALRKMGTLISDEEFVQLAVKIGESRLVTIACEKVSHSADLLSQIDVKNKLWRQIWFNSSRKNSSPWIGIIHPDKVLFALFEDILSGSDVDSDLLFALSNSDHNDLAAFGRRTEVWKLLNEPITSGFLKATAISCVKLIDVGSISIDDLEEDIKLTIVNPELIKQVIRNEIISVSTKIKLYENLPGLNESSFLLLLENVKFSSSESHRIGKLVLSKDWGNAASAISRMISSRADLKTALTECKSLLSFFEKLFLSAWGQLSEPISMEEWWQAFTEQCYEKYARGPTELGLWERAGGKNYDLSIGGSGREVWVDAIKKINTGKIIIDINKLLEEMLDDFPGSKELKHLKESYNR